METQERQWNEIVRASRPYRPDFARHYQMTETELGRGAFGVVYLARVLNKPFKRAVKLVLIDRLEREHANLSKQMLIKEVNALKLLEGHRNILALYNTFTENVTRRNQLYFYMVTGYANKNSLRQMMTDENDSAVLHPISPTRAQSYAVQIVDALEHCYKHGVVHRDIKLGNILIHEEKSGLETAILSDFGKARISEKGRDLDANFMNKQVTTLEYRAPEMLENKNYSFRCELWSLGVLIYVMLSGNFPFTGTEEEMKRQISTAGVTFRDPVWEELDHASSFIERCLLLKNPNLRKMFSDLSKEDWLRVDLEL